eukprot:gene20266-20844_t
MSEKINKSGDNKDLDNLLGLDWNLDSNSNSAVAPSFAPASNSFAASSSAGSSKMEKDKEVAGKDKEKLSGLFWLPLYSDKNIEISYNVQTTSSSSEVTVVFKTLNLSKDGSRLSAAIKLSPSDPSKRFVKALQTNLLGDSEDSIEIAGSVSAGKDSKTTLILSLSSSFSSIFANFRDAASGALSVGCSVMVCVDSLLGPEAYPVVAVLKIPLSSSFVANKLDEQAFSTAIGKSSSRWAAKSISLSSSCKSKTAFKAISG